jgi:hypothetical protein
MFLSVRLIPLAQCLEERGLIARTPVIMTTQRNQRSNGVVTTNVLHLTRYAPAVRLGPSQVFKVGLRVPSLVCIHACARWGYFVVRRSSVVSIRDVAQHECSRNVLL